MKVVFLQDVPEVASPKGDRIGPFERGDKYKLSKDAAQLFVNRGVVAKLSERPLDGQWELVRGSEQVGLLSQDGENGNLALTIPPFVYECGRCGELHGRSEPKEPTVCRNPNCSKQNVFKPLHPKKLEGQVKDGELDPDWTSPNLPKKTGVEEVYSGILKLLKEHLVLKDEDEYHLLACWTIATWRREDFRTAPHILFRGEIHSGKTRGLEILSEVSYRGITTVGTSPAYLTRTTEWFNTTVMLDEAKSKMNRKFEQGAWMYDFVLSSYRRGSLIGRCRKADPSKTDRFRPFTFMALAERGSFDAAVNDRCIIIDMESNTPEKEEIDKEQARELRTELLWLRLNDEFEIPETGLHGRTREKFVPILAVAKRVGEFERLEEFALDYERKMRGADIDELKSMISEMLLNASRKGEKIMISELRTGLEDQGLEISSSKVGRVTNDMGFEAWKHRSRDGTYINLAQAQDKIDYWADYYDL